MDEPFVCLLLSLVLPLAWFAPRLGLTSTPVLRFAVTLFLLALIVLRFPRTGVDSISLGRIDLLIAAAVVLILWMRRFGAAWACEPSRYRRALTAAALAAAISYTNFLHFHGGSWIHFHDVAHYYLGSKYFAELGYGDLYVGLLRAEQEEYGYFLTGEARDLSGSYLLPVDRLLDRSDAVKARFSAARWTDFRTDVRLFRDAMGQSWGEVLKDHGYNPTPVWSLVGGAFANHVPAGSRRGVFLLTLLDPLLVGATFVAVAATLGAETALLSIVYFCICYGAGFPWTGGAFLRELSFSAILLCAVLAACSWSAAAGGCLALAALLRVYPAFLIVGPGLRAASQLVRGEQVSPSLRRFLLGFASVSLLLLGATLLAPHGLEHWLAFGRNVVGHGESASANVIGLTNWLAYGRSFEPGSSSALTEAIDWRRSVYRVQLATVFLATVVWTALRSQKQDDLVSLLGLGTLLVFTGLNLSGYYYTFLVLLVVAHRNQQRELLWIFAAELLLYVTQLFEQHDPMLYLYKSLFLAWMFLALNLDALEARRVPSSSNS